MALWIKSFHIISFVCWFAAIFYLPRLFVYHTQVTDEENLARFKTMEKKLYYFIMVPSMIATLLFGVKLVFLNSSYFLSSGWFHAKMALVFILIGYHHVCGAHVKRFARDENQKSERFFRVFNEIPVVLLIAIVILAVVRPF